MSAPAITISERKPRESGTLCGFFTAHLPSGLTLHELMLHERRQMVGQLPIQTNAGSRRRRTAR
jgi:hypothetical protein